MEFVVDEQKCRQLSMDMLTTMKEIASVVSEIESQNSTLKTALGDDYESIARSVRVMTSELSGAQSELNVIINDMEEYMARVHQAHIALN